MFTGIVRDEDLALHGEVGYLNQCKGFYNPCDMVDETGSGIHDGVIQGMSTIGSEGERQSEHAATLQYFLERKEYLLESLKVLNNLAEQELALQARVENSSAEKNCEPEKSQFTDTFLQQHQWVIDNVVRSDHIIGQLIQQLNSDPSLKGQDVKPHSPSNERSVIDAVWSEQYELLGSVVIPACSSNPSGLLLGGDRMADAVEGLGVIVSTEESEHRDAIPGGNLGSDNDNNATASDVIGMDSVLNLYKTCVCCLCLLRKFQIDEFCRPKDLCEYLVSKVDGYNDIAPMRNVVQKIEAICFGLS